MTLVGALGHDARAIVDPRGRARIDGERWELDWWIGADDRWHFPAAETAVRQLRLDGMPVVQTAMRIPSGDAVERVLGAGDGRIAIEIENASPAAFAVAFVVTGARSITLEDATVVVDDRPALRTPRPPGRWAIAPRDELVDVVTHGHASVGAFSEVRDRRRRMAVAFLHPVAHRTTTTAVLGASDPTGLPEPTSVARGWRAQLGRGLRVEVPDARLQELVDGARAQLVLRAGLGSDPELMAALEDWGLDDEASLAWERLRLRDRGRARRRSVRLDHWPDTGWLEREGCARFLLAVRDVLGRESNGTVDLLRALPSAWRGQGLEVHDLPVKAGIVSYVVRWHGPRPALLWDAPSGLTLRAPGLDPGWSTTSPTGEALLRP